MQIYVLDLTILSFNAKLLCKYAHGDIQGIKETDCFLLYTVLLLLLHLLLPLEENVHSL